MTSPTPEALWSARTVRLLRPAAVRCHRLTRATRGGYLLDGLNLAVPVGARLLLLSDPAATAPVLLRILAGLARRDSGSIEVAGLPGPAPTIFSERVAYLGRSLHLPRWMTPREACDFAVRAAGLDPGEGARRSRVMLERLGLSSVADRPIGRIGPLLAEQAALASALLPDPDVILLDEPLAGHDPVERRRLLWIGGRRTVIIASAAPSVHAELCDQVALIRNGRLALHAPIGMLEAQGLPISVEGVERLISARPAAHAGAASR